jgi:hypothetical protein
MLLKDLQELAALLQPLVARKLATTMADEWAYIQQEVLDPQVGWAAWVLLGVLPGGCCLGGGAGSCLVCWVLLGPGLVPAAWVLPAERREAGRAGW